MIDWLETLSPNEKEAFLTFCKKHSSPIQMYLYARFLGFTGNIVECDEWQQSTFKKRNLQQILEIEIDNMREDVEKLRQAIDLGMVKQDNGTARIAMLQKELRGAIKQIQDERYVGDKQGLILAGADRALREIVLIFKDDPIEVPLEEASMSVWSHMQMEE